MTNLNLMNIKLKSFIPLPRKLSSLQNEQGRTFIRLLHFWKHAWFVLTKMIVINSCAWCATYVAQRNCLLFWAPIPQTLWNGGSTDRTESTQMLEARQVEPHIWENDPSSQPPSSKYWKPEAQQRLSSLQLMTWCLISAGLIISWNTKDITSTQQ